MLRFLSHQWVLLLFIVFLSIPALFPLTRQGFFPTQDYIYVARVYELNSALSDGQFPVRWSPDFRYGDPTFNFYAPLPYYIGAVVKNTGLSYLETVKVLFGLGFLLSGLAMYFLAKEYFGKLGGLVSAMLYIYAPYHSVDVYVRGALSESWALIFFPLIFLFSKKLADKPGILNIIWLALSLTGLFFTHNIMTLLFMPFAIAWWMYLLWQGKNWKNITYFIIALGLGIGLAASFLLPAFFEKSFVQSDRLIKGYFDFRGHFVAIPQFFSIFWGYGASLWGSHDDMSFQVGLVHWAVIILALFGVFKFKRSKTTSMLAIFLTAEFLFSLFMQHNKSAPIWERFSQLLAYTQFPWRFLGVSIFFASFLGGLIVFVLPARYRKVIFLSLIIVIIAGNIAFFRPDSYYFDSIDDHYISKKTLSIDDRIPKDYLPIWVKKIEDSKFETPVVREGKVEIRDFNKRSSTATFNASIKDDAVIETPITYFPGWEVRANGKLVKLEDPGELGLVKFRLPKGDYKIDMQFSDTPIRANSNKISLASLGILGFLLAGSKLKK